MTPALTLTACVAAPGGLDSALSGPRLLRFRLAPPPRRGPAGRRLLPGLHLTLRALAPPSLRQDSLHALPPLPLPRRPPAERHRRRPRRLRLRLPAIRPAQCGLPAAEDAGSHRVALERQQRGAACTVEGLRRRQRLVSAAGGAPAPRARAGLGTACGGECDLSTQQQRGGGVLAGGREGTGRRAVCKLLSEICSPHRDGAQASDLRQ